MYIGFVQNLNLIIINFKETNEWIQTTHQPELFITMGEDERFMGKGCYFVKNNKTSKGIIPIDLQKVCIFFFFLRIQIFLKNIYLILYFILKKKFWGGNSIMNKIYYLEK